MSLETMSRTEALLAIVLVQNMGAASQRDKAVALSRAGLSSPEIAALLETTPAVITQALYEVRKAKKLPAAKKTAAKKTAAKKTAAKKAGQ